MRIAMITPGFSASAEDWCIPALRNLALNLGAEHDVDLYTASYPHRTDEYQIDNVRVYSFGTGKGGHPARLAEYFRLGRALMASHRRDRYDLLHGFWANQGGLSCLILGKWLGVPTLVTVMGGELTYEPRTSYGKGRGIGGMIVRCAASRAGRLGTLSMWHAQSLRQISPRLTSTCLPFGVDTELFSPVGPAAVLSGETRFIVVGSLVAVKGHAVALGALDILRRSEPDRDLFLHIVGDGPLRERLQTEVDRLGLRRSVEFHGHVSHDQLPRYYRAATACLLTSHFETSAMVVMEAAACGRVTIGSAVGSMPEIIPNRYLCNPGDPQGLATAMRRFLDDGTRPNSLQTRMTESVRSSYTIAAMTDRYAEQYRHLIESHR